MRNVKRLGAVAVALVLAVALADAVGAAEITVGQFVQQLARAKNLEAQDAATAQQSLVNAGVAVPSSISLDATLTEDVVARLSVASGLNVRTARPDAVFSLEQAERYFTAFQRELGAGTRGESGGAQLENDKRWGWGHGHGWGNGWGHGHGNGNGNGNNGGGQGEGHGKGKGKGGQTPSDPY